MAKVYPKKRINFGCNALKKNTMSHFKKHPTLARSISNYARMGIIIEILTLNTTEAKVKVIQKTALNGYLLNQQQLVERVRKVFAPTGLKVNVLPRGVGVGYCANHPGMD